MSDALLNDTGALGLAQLAEEVAARLVASLHSERDVSNVFSALHRLFSRSIAHVATAWNTKNDRSRVLPPEIQELCFSPLPLAQKCQLSLVCSHWHRNTTSLPALWTAMDVRRNTADLDALLARSGQLPVDLAFAQPWTPPFDDLDRCIRGNSHHLRRLTLTLSDAQSHYLSFFYPAPQLEELSLSFCLPAPQQTERLFSNMWDDIYLSIAPTIFAQCAPRLQTIYLYQVELPPFCPAFGSATSVTLDQCRGSLPRFLKAVPLLRSLNIVTCSESYELQTIPARSSSVEDDGLPEIRLTWEGLTIDRFSRLVTTLGSLTITENVYLGLLRYAAQHFTTPTSTLRFRCDRALEFITQLSGCTMRFSAPSMTVTIRLGGLTNEIRVLDTLERFELPASFDNYNPARSLMDESDVVSLPGLRTLVIHSAGSYEDAFFMLRPGVLRGRFYAPLLTRIELTKSPDSTAEAVDADHLAHFILDVLDVGDREGLELSVGLQLEGDVDGLRSLIGKIVV